MKKVKTIIIFMLIVTFVQISLFSNNVQAEKYKYDSLNRVTEVQYDSGEIVKYEYDVGGNIKKIEHKMPNLKKIKLNKNKILIDKEKNFKIEVTAIYKDKTETKVSDGVNYSSSDEKIAIVDSDGKITAKKRGTAVISVDYCGKTAKLKVRVTEAKYKSLDKILYLFDGIIDTIKNILS